MGGLGTPGTRLHDRLGKATGLERNAHAYCVGNDARHAKKSLKGAFRRLGKLRGLLTSKASKSLPGRDALLASLDAIRRDVRTLKGALACSPGATP